MLETISYAKDTKAAKDHVCNFCSMKIKKGEVYDSSTHKFDGRIYDWKSHKHCSEIAVRLKMYDNTDEGMLTEDDFVETIKEEHFHLLIKQMSQEDVKKYTDIVQQLRWVNFKEQLWYVISHHKKLDNHNTK